MNAKTNHHNGLSLAHKLSSALASSKFYLGYCRYALSALAAVTFGLSGN